MGIGTPNLDQAIRRAVSRADELGEDLIALRERVRNRDPAALDNPAEKDQRRKFLESLYGDQREANQVFERIIGGNELQDANYLTRGDLVARTVFRIAIRGAGGRLLGYGSGFMVGESVLITNNHVLPDRETARASEFQAGYDRAIDGTDNEPRIFRADVDRLFFTSVELDFTVLALTPRDVSGRHLLGDYGWLPLIAQQGKVVPGEWLTIIQHPKGERKQLCIRENQLLKCEGDVLWYSSDTLGGSSGSPVFNNDWLVVALHHSGVPKTKNGKWQTIDGTDYRPGIDGEDRIRWIANEGIRVSRILELLRIDPQTADHPLARGVTGVGVFDIRYRVPVIKQGGGQGMVDATVVSHDSGRHDARILPPALAKEEEMTTRRITVTLEIDDDGQVSVVGGGSGAEMLDLERSQRRKQVIDAPVIPQQHWGKATGFDEAFLGAEFKVHMPQVLKRAGPVAPLNDPDPYTGQSPQDAGAGVLNYDGYSVVMHAERRLAFFSAANVDGGVQFPNLGRGRDVWLFDDRIEKKHQLGNDYYRGNKLDRGHLTRREDLEWGLNPVEATLRANGTCVWTNCSPQHSIFNQDKSPDPAVRLWGGLEKYILEQTARHYRFKVQVITGPIFGEFDPEYRGARIPLAFWKIVAAVNAEERLFATGYVISQSKQIVVDQLDEAAPAVPFGAFQTYQRKISEIAEVTGLDFLATANSPGPSANMVQQPLSHWDPLEVQQAKPVWQRRRSSAAGLLETARIESPAFEDAPLGGFEDLVLDF